MVCTGKEVGDKGGQETSSVVVETVQKISKNSKAQGPVLPLFKSDASKVTCKGMGLKKAYLQKQNQFTINAGDAGKNFFRRPPKASSEYLNFKFTGFLTQYQQGTTFYSLDYTAQRVPAMKCSSNTWATITIKSIMCVASAETTS